MTYPFSISDVTIIVVTYNSAHCISGLAKALATMPNVIIVDNASEDDTVTAAVAALPNAVILCNERNLGFGAANNRALKKTATRYALLLNPDCLPTHDGLTGMLRAAAQYPDAAIIAPHLVGRDGSVEVSYRFPYSRWTSGGPAAEGACCVGFVCGAVMLLNMESMREVGFFDEEFFLYYEDEDLCQRTFMAHMPIVVVPEISITHLSRGSVRGPRRLRAEFFRGFHHVQSKLIFTGKHTSQEAAARLRRRTMLLALAALPLRLLMPAPKYVARLLGRLYGLYSYTRPQQ